MAELSQTLLEQVTNMPEQLQSSINDLYAHFNSFPMVLLNPKAPILVCEETDLYFIKDEDMEKAFQL